MDELLSGKISSEDEEEILQELESLQQQEVGQTLICKDEMLTYILLSSKQTCLQYQSNHYLENKWSYPKCLHMSQLQKKHLKVSRIKMNSSIITWHVTLIPAKEKKMEAEAMLAS